MLKGTLQPKALHEFECLVTIKHYSWLLKDVKFRRGGAVSTDTLSTAIISTLIVLATLWPLMSVVRSMQRSYTRGINVTEGGIRV
jgi:hypothetical protein